MRAAFTPVFERHGVQLAISSHEHDYERTVAWRDGAADPAGVTYLVTGGGGAPLYPSATDAWTAHSASVFHYLRGTATECLLDVDAIGLDGGSFDRVSLKRCEPPVDTQNPTVSVTAPSAGTTARGNLNVTVNASDNVGVVRVDLLIDGQSVAQDTTAPFGFVWDTTAVSNGTHTLAARATDAAGNSTTSAGVSITLDNLVPGPGDIVLYAADATVIGGRWVRTPDATAAGGASLRNPDAGAAKVAAAAANPADYFELTFNAQADVPYHLWIRSKADANYWANDSVFIQFSGATNYAIGTTSAAESNLEDCSGCKLAGWGWQDTGWGVGVAGSPITFTSTGQHRIRIQRREDGVAIDQIILSPSQFFTESPGALKNDARIYPRAAGGSAPPSEPDTQNPVVAITSPASGETVSGTVTVTTSATDNAGVARVDLLVDGAIVGTMAAPPFTFSWDTHSSPNGTHVLEARAYDAAGNAGSSGDLPVSVSNAPQPPADTQNPTASITSPSAGATVSGTVTVSVAAADNVGVARVELLAGTAVVATRTTAPFDFSWDTRSVPDGTHDLTARAFDAAGNQGSSAAVSVTVDNAAAGPAEIVLYAADATVVSGAWRRETIPLLPAAPISGIPTRTPQSWPRHPRRR